MEKFNRISLLEKRKMAIEDLVKYCAEYRKYEYNNGRQLEGLKLRKKIHFIINLILKLDQVLSKEKIVILHDEHNPNVKGPKIFACTHIGGNDIQRTFQIIDSQAYLMLGDPGILYKMPIYEALKLNGVIPLETTDREDRKIAYNRSVELLNKGSNLLIYPEGAWNVSPNLLVMKIFTGTVRIAKDTNASIIPIAVEQYGNTFFFNIGKEYKISEYCQKSNQELTDELRDKLVTLKWDLIETQPILKRETISSDELDRFQTAIVEKCNYGYGFSLQDAINESFHDKNCISEEEVFNDYEGIDINQNNAFLARQKHEFSLKK